MSLPGSPTIEQMLSQYARARVFQVAAQPVLTVSDDQTSFSREQLLEEGYKVLLDKLDVSTLSEKRKARFDDMTNSVALLVRPTQNYANGIPLPKAAEIVENYLIEGYEAPKNGKLVREAMLQLASQASHGIVQYR